MRELKVLRELRDVATGYCVYKVVCMYGVYIREHVLVVVTRSWECCTGYQGVLARYASYVVHLANTGSSRYRIIQGVS